MGVKSLWTLLTPVGRPVLLETVEGKVMAIDSSIWIYQFQATMRAKDGQALINAHVLGFLRRICKLLFYGIKPVFVFDGGAPVLKRATLRERKEKKSGAAASHVKIAEKLLAAQMRREALNHADRANESSSKGKERLPGPPTLNEETVYLEDVDPSASKSPVKHRPESSSPKKAKFYDHDPYRLPEVDLEAQVVKATRTVVPDPRLATEEELRAFIEEMRPEDFDVTSPEFRELPTEVQYEIVGDLRLKSRQTSYVRLQNMLKNSPTPLEFSKQQIKNLQQRNTLTQQLLITTDSIGSAHISIPVRIASERNKQYVLIKNEGESGGWILGIRDDGTRQKPIEIDQDDVQDDDDGDDDMEEVEISAPAPMDSDLRDYHQTMALVAIGKRATQQQAKRVFSKDDSPRRASFLSGDEDEELAFAIQASLDQRTTSTPLKNVTMDFGSPSRLETSLFIANAGTVRPHGPPRSPETFAKLFGRPTLLSARQNAEAGPSRSTGSIFPSSTSHTLEKSSTPASSTVFSDSYQPSVPVHSQDPTPLKDRLLPQYVEPSPPDPHPVISKQVDILPENDTENTTAKVSMPDQRSTSPPEPSFDKEAGPVDDILPSKTSKSAVVQSSPIEAVPSPRQVESESGDDMEEILPRPQTQVTSEKSLPIPTANETSTHRTADKSGILSPPMPLVTPPANIGEEEQDIPWSRSPSPSADLPSIQSSLSADQSFDAAQEMDPDVEEGEYARFLSQVKGKAIEDVRREIDEEIKSLNQQKKAAMRDSEDVTQQMINQIMAMLRLFGIPYMTAPMEAEAQCAELVTLGLVDGVITDDSDVFLFGAQRVFKNMFNQSKTVECFLLSDLNRELGLDRDTLVRLAYLLGSDYVDGLPGVGPVVAMELLKEFPGEDGLHKFKEWWMKVQTGRDKAEDNKSKFRKQFKKKFKELYLPDDWPNPAVKEAYYCPLVDSSDEPFKWGLPDLDALRSFFREELSWGQAKVDETLLPIIQKMNKRGQAAAMNRQSTLTGFLDIAGGSGTSAPRKRQAYTSKRLQNVVDDLRKKRGSGSASPKPSQSPAADESESEQGPPSKKKKGKGTVTRSASKSASKPKPRKRVGGGKSSAKKRKFDEDDSSDSDTKDMEAVDIPPDPEVAARLRPRPKPRPVPRQPREQVDGDIR